MSIKTRVEKLEDGGPQKPIVVFQDWNETTDEVMARWQAQHPDEDLKNRTVQLLSWEREK